MAKEFTPKKLLGQDITVRQAELIKEQFDQLKNEGRIAKNSSFEKWFYKNEVVMDLFFNQEVRQAVDYSSKYLVNDSNNFDVVKVNGKSTGAEGLERAIDQFENFVYGTIEGVSNIRYSPSITMKQNILNQKFPNIKELKRLADSEEEEEEDLADMFQRWKEEYGIVIYYSPLK
jgi:hypothetical protein